ncbi:hypothetical protein BHE74_00053957 [Ensete ventricosum]|nr:hypothetical protein BHE74_00053957 [Ensete ventricosum]
MFNLDKMKSDGGVGNGSVTLSATSAPTAGDAGVSTVEKHPSSGVEAGLRKRLQKVPTEQPTDASGSTARTSVDKGKGTVELEEVPKRGYTMRELCKVKDRAGADREYLRGALHPTLVKQVYECSFEELMNRADKSAVWGLHFVNALIDWVHDVGRLVWNQHEKILALRAANKELKASVGQELVAAAEWWVKELEAEIERMWAELESHRSQRRELEQEVGLLHSTFLEAELKVAGQKAMAAYKASRGFQSGLGKMGRVNYMFGYRVALERLWGKHSDIMIELDPFTECSEDANVKMDLDQPFDDGTPSEKQLTL